MEQVQNEHDLAAIETLVHHDCADHSGIMPPELGHGRDGLRRFFTLRREAFPDLHFSIEDQIAEGDRVVTGKRLHGTQRGALFGIPATGRTVDVDVIDILTVVDGQVRDHWGDSTAWP